MKETVSRMVSLLSVTNIYVKSPPNTYLHRRMIYNEIPPPWVLVITVPIIAIHIPFQPQIV